METKEKFERAKRLYKTANADQKYVLESIFPELSESEDERIRKVLIELSKEVAQEQFFTNRGTNLQNVIAWLEKQGKQNLANSAKTCKVEPKFKVGDKIRRKEPRSFDKDMQVARIEKDYYVCNHIGKFSSEVVPFSKESSYELIEQNPAWSEDIEYIRTDAFIKKARKWFEMQPELYDANGVRCYSTEDFEDFRKYMKGE